MKTLLTTTLTALLALSVLAPAQAAGYIKFDGVDGEIRATQQALEDLKAPETEEAIALLLPAVQKIREAASKMRVTCDDPTGAGIDADCAAQTLAKAILESETGRDGSPGLLDLFATAQKKSIKEAKIIGNVSRQQGAAGTEYMLVGILIGLLKETQHQGITESKVLEPIIAAIKVADEIDPSFACAKSGKGGNWNLKENNGR